MVNNLELCGTQVERVQHCGNCVYHVELDSLHESESFANRHHVAHALFGQVTHMHKTGKGGLVVKDAPRPGQPEKLIVKLFGPTVEVMVLGTWNLFAGQRIHIKHSGLKLGGPRFW